MLTTFASQDDFSAESAGDYPVPVMWINGRRVFIDRIRKGEESARSPFEDTTFSFIRDWLTGREHFELKTSGSTGKPKTITVSRKQMVMSALKTAAKINLRRNATALVGIDTRYIAGKMMLVRAMVLALPIAAVDPCANPLIKIPVDKCVQFTAFVPYQISHILESKHPHLLNNLNKVLIGGAPLHAKEREQLERFQCACYETYGMTETVSHIALRLVNTPEKQTSFEVLPGVDIHQDERGCLVINADHLPDAVVTNDLVELTGPGSFIWLGRWDNVINSGGIKVSPEKIEQQLERIFHQNALGHRFFIAASPDEKLGSRIVLVLEGVQFSSEILNKSLEKLRSLLPPYEIPREVRSTPVFTMTDTHKIDRRQSLANASLLSV